MMTFGSLMVAKRNVWVVAVSGHYEKILEGESIMKRTLENCSLIKQSIHIGVGRPNQRNGLCQGYSYPDDDEPCETCKNCKLCTQGYYQLGEE